MWFSIYLKKGAKNDKSDLLNKYLVIHCDADFIKLVISGLDLPNLYSAASLLIGVTSRDN